MPIVAVIPQPNASVEVREVPSPELEKDSALLDVELSEVCGTDVYLQQGRLQGVPYPLVPGHVSVGRLNKIRGTILDVEGRKFREGDRVTFLDVHRTCNACWYCLVAKATTRCPQRKVYGITYGLDDGLCGGWAEQIYLKPGTRCIRLDAPAETFMAGGCALPTALHAVARGEISIGDTIGHATPIDVARLTEALLPIVPPDKLAYHFHDTLGFALAASGIVAMLRESGTLHLSLSQALAVPLTIIGAGLLVGTVIGRARFEGSPVLFSDTVQDNWRSAPLLGEDNEHVFTTLLGMSTDEVATLAEDGIL